MSALVVKAICRRIEARYGSNRNAALAAGVSGGVWSNYCSDDQPDTTIPFHRLLLVADTAEKAAFMALLQGEAGPPPAALMTEAAETTEKSAEMQGAVRAAIADGKVTNLEARRIRDLALQVQADAGDVIAAVSP